MHRFLYTIVVKAKSEKFLIGIDEVGRGPLAGPVAVGVAMATPEAIRKFKKIKESKQLSKKQREEWYAKISDKQSGIHFAVSFVSAQVIDKRGIVPAIRLALLRGLTKLSPNPKHSRILLDGGLHAPEEFTNQETIIRGDAKETIIAIASVVAKVKRDRSMVRMHRKYPEYGFDQHAGYGTKKHMNAIRKYGLTPLHRITFCKFVVE